MRNCTKISAIFAKNCTKVSAVLKIIKSKLGRFGQWLDEVYNPWMEKYNYTRVSDFIRDAVLDKRLTQRQVVEIEPYKIDNNRLIPQVIDAIRTYDFRLVRAIAAFEEALNIPYVDPELIHMHARRLRLIGAALGGKIEWLIRFMEGKRPEVMG